jgi:hypothetical protein
MQANTSARGSTFRALKKLSMAELSRTSLSRLTLQVMP